MATLAYATLDVARELPGWMITEGAATGGSTTTLVDTGFPWLIDGTNPPADDYYNGGTVWLLTGDNAGKTAMVTDWARGTKTATFAALANAVAANDQYAIAPKDWPRFVLRQAVNAAISQIGNVDQRDATLTTVATQAAYTLPAGVHNVRRVEIARSTTTPYAYTIQQHWREIGGTIEFASGYEPGLTGYPIRLTYQAPLARLDEDSDTIPDLIHPELVKMLGLLWACRWKVGRIDASEKGKVQALNEAMARAERSASVYLSQVERTPREHQSSFWAGMETDAPESDVDVARY